MIYNMFMFHELDIFRTPENGLNFDNLAKIAHKIAKSKYFVNIENESESPINSPSPPPPPPTHTHTHTLSYSAKVCNIWFGMILIGLKNSFCVQSFTQRRKVPNI